MSIRREDRPTGARWWRRVGWRHGVGILAAAFALFPVLYIVSASLNPLGTVAATSLIPTRISLDNFFRLLGGEKGPFAVWLANSLLIAAAVSFGQVLCSALAAYAFSRFRFRGRRGGLLALLFAQMFPQFLAAVALFLMVARFGEVLPAVGLNTLLGYGLVLMGGALGQVWILKGFFDSVPRELDEAAMLDGASHWQAFTRVILPLVSPALAVAALLCFIGVIGDFMLASIFLTDDAVKTVAVGLYGIILGDKSTNLGIFSAGCVLLTVPVVVLFLWLQRFIVGGLTAGTGK
ncbi:ABC transporter permease subunit [Microbacterium sp.]|uniref:sugar ABC transporter permease n=1 Tax=Microbacterium sp. TaxID=51671 RepID=UPI0033407CDE